MRITNEELKKMLSYDESSGVFTWNIIRYNNSAGIGDIAGSTHKQSGYSRVKINGLSYKMHKLAWQYVYGYYTNESIDHINGVKNDNRISNLRLCSNSQNQANQGKHRDNTSGFKGVCWGTKNKKWRARISQNNKRKFLGYYDSPEIAAIVYDITALELFGKFAKTNF